MAEKGTLLVRSYVSRAQLPVSNAVVIVSTPDTDGRYTLKWIGLTDENGVSGPIALDTPDKNESLVPGNNSSSFSNYTLVVEHPNYQIALFRGVQIFSGVETVQDVPMIPLSLNERNESDLTTVTPQPL